MHGGEPKEKCWGEDQGAFEGFDRVGCNVALQKVEAESNMGFNEGHIANWSSGDIKKAQHERLSDAKSDANEASKQGVAHSSRQPAVHETTPRTHARTGHLRGLFLKFLLGCIACIALLWG